MDVRTSTPAAPVVEYAPRPASPSPEPSAATLSDRVLALADRHRRKLLVVLLFIYLLGFNAQWRVEPDSALYLTVGRNLAEGHGYTFHGQPHHLAYPGLPLLFSGIFKLFGSGTLVPSLVIMLLIGAATLALTYRLFYLFAGRPTAVLMTFGVGISRLFYRYCFELLSDMPFLLGVMAFLAGFEAIFHRRSDRNDSGGDGGAHPAKWFDWLLLIGGLATAIAMRPSMWALLLATVLALAWSTIRGGFRWKQAIPLGLAVLAAGVVFWKFDPRRSGHAAMGDYEDALVEFAIGHVGTLIHNLFFINIPKLFQATLSQTLFGARLGPGLSDLAGVGVVLVCATMLRDRPLWFLWVAMTFVMMLVAIEPLDRYFLEALPLMVFAWWRGIRWLNHRLPQMRFGGRRVSRAWADWIFAGLFILGGTVNLMRVGGFVVEQRRPHFLNSYKEGRYASSKQVARLLHDRVDPHGWVLATPKFARILTFLSHRNVVGPREPVDLDPSREPVFVLQPIDDLVRERLDEAQIRIGAQVGPEIQSKYDPEPWRLRKAEPQ
jgi:hypothetical protein